LLDPGNFSEVTNLPHAIDMIEEHVGIPRVFTRDFIHEVELELLLGTFRARRKSGDFSLA
jgi:hypothetical protein